MRSRRSVLSRNTDVVRMRHYLQAFSHGYIGRHVEITTHASGCAHEERDGKTNEANRKPRGDAAPRHARTARSGLRRRACALERAMRSQQSPNADQATRMYNRIAGIPPTATELAADDGDADPVSAALIATNDPAFYNDTIRNLAAPWTNRDQSVFVPLNDYTATVVGMVRDNVPFNTLLSADLRLHRAMRRSGVPAYSPANNDMYHDDGRQQRRSEATHLVSSTQSALTGIPVDGHRRRDDHPRRRERLLRQRHEPRDVPLHDDESSVQRPADRHGHHPAAGPHPPGRDAQPGRRQHACS